jgi:alpha-mannosidase
MHRGTLTTQAKVKKANRKLELKLREVEFLWSCLALDKYPDKELDGIWKKMLLNQFHDILPGSSINAVYEVTRAELHDALKQCDELTDQAAQLLFKKDTNALVLFNSLSYTFRGSLELPAGWGCKVVDEDGILLTGQTEHGKVVIFVNIPSHSFKTLKKSDQFYESGIPDNNLILENELIRYEFSEQGTLIQAYDKEARREIIAQGRKGNVFSLYEDRPNQWDAWEVDIFYENQLLETAQCSKAEKLIQGPVRQGLRFEFNIGRSEFEQTIFLANNSKRLDFKTHVKWHEKHRMLRVSFAVNVRSDQASYDIQYGYVKRNTHRNTSWDMAKFEVAAQRYADLSEQDYGVALLNDCKYGYKVFENVVDLNLLRAPTNPDPDADQGEHEFTYGLLPHTGDLIHSNVISEAAQLNQGLAVFAGYSSGDAAIPCRIEGEGLSLEVLKKAEKEKSLIIRIIETLGRYSSGQLYLSKKPQAITETNLLEWTNDAELSCDVLLKISLCPFEIKTFKIKL